MEGKWFLHVQGHTVGPLATEEVLLGLQNGEFSSQDKICSPADPAWQNLAEHPRFADHGSLFSVSSNDLVAPPSPRILRMRKQAAVEIPPAPAIPEILPEPVIAAAIADEPKILPSPPLEPVAEEMPMPVAAQKERSEPASPASSLIPPRPDFQPVFLAEPPRREEILKKKKFPTLQAKPENEARAPTRVIKIELKLPERPLRILVLLCMLMALAVVAGNWVTANKTRDLKDSRLPDPSSPTVTPLETGDPIPPLKAPTRPQRE
jgi:hypothetical protein